MRAALVSFLRRDSCFQAPRYFAGKDAGKTCLPRGFSRLTLHSPCLHASSSFPFLLLLVPLGGVLAAEVSLCSHRCSCLGGDQAAVCPLLFRLCGWYLCPAPGWLLLRPHNDLLLCFGSDRFPVGWLPVVFSLSCTDENSPFCCEGQTMHG